jgi:DNA polymerase-3 subunit gamma/tau
MSTLYRDYRPQNFSEVLGQNHIKITLQNEIAAGKLAQAFLFCGPRAVGKTTLARVLAKTVNCQDRPKGDPEPCNHCASCQAITQGKNLDVVEIDAASNTGVDNVRENIINFSRLAPASSNYKVFIIDEVHMLSISAFNALLKIIEEPPRYVIFILCTTEIQKVPATIISRCERFDFKRISVADIVKKLTLIANRENIQIDPEVLEAVARRSGGHLRDAESLLGQIFALGEKKISLEKAELIIPHYNSNEAISLLECLSRKDAAKAITLVNSLVDSGVNIKNFNGELVGLARKLLLDKINPGLADSLGLNLGDALEMKLTALVANYDTETLANIIKRLLESYNDNRQPLISQLPLELAIVDLCYERPSSPIISRPAPVMAAPAKKASMPAAKPESQGSAPARISHLNLSQEEVQEKWPEFLIKIKKHNHSLSFVLQNCQPQAVSDGCLELLFKYKFHKDRVCDPAIKGVVNEVLTEVFGETLSFSAAIDENLEIIPENPAPEMPTSIEGAEKEKEEKPAPASALNDLLQAFGGEVVN